MPPSQSTETQTGGPHTGGWESPGGQHMPSFLFYPTGSPGSPRDVLVTKSASALTLQWTEGNAGRAPTTGYVIEARPSGEGGRAVGARVGHCPRHRVCSVSKGLRASTAPLLPALPWRRRGREGPSAAVRSPPRSSRDINLTGTRPPVLPTAHQPGENVTPRSEHPRIWGYLEVLSTHQ